MSKLLVPIDFTADSKAAIRYACAIAATNGQSIDFIHAFNDNEDIYAEALKKPDLIDPRVPKAQQQAAKLLNKLQEKYPNLNANVLFYDGGLYKALDKQIEKASYDAIVIGKDGESGLLPLYINNKTYSTISNAKLPVLAVPSDARDFKKDRIALLCNFKDAELSVLKQARPLIGQDFGLILIHVNKNEESESSVHQKFELFSEKIKTEIGIENITHLTKPKTYYEHQKQNLSTAIHNVLLEENIDLVLVTKSKKSLFRNITEENIVKKMTILLKIPKFFAKVE